MANPFDQFDNAQGGAVFGAPPPPKTPSFPSGYEADPARPGAIRPIPGGPADDQVVPTPGDLSKTGDAYLATLPPGLAGQVKAMSEGRRAYPTGTALKDPKIQELIAAATQYDPTLDAANAATRVATRKDFTSGVTARNITSLNTALGHLGQLSQAAEALDNSRFPLWNTIANTGETAIGDPRVKEFGIARDAVANELMRVFRGAGSGSMQEIEDWKNTISSSDSPEQLREEIGKAVELLDSRLQALGDQYQRGLGQSKDPITLLSPHAQDVYKALGPGGSGNLPLPDMASPQGVTGSTNGFNEAPANDAGAFLDSLVRQGVPYKDALVQFQQQFPGFKGPKGEPGFSPSQYRAAVVFAQQHPDTQYRPTQAIERTPLTPTEQTASSAAMSPLGAFVGNFANGATAGLPVAAAGDQGQYFQQVSNAQHPFAAPAGDILGSTAGMLAGEGALAKAGMQAGLKRELAANMAYGGIRGGAENGPGGAVTGALAAGGGTLAGSALLRGTGAALRGVTNKDVNALSDAGMRDFTMGQIAGGKFKSAEDKLTSVPWAGDAIKARRAEGYKQFNAGAFDQALKPINGTVGDLTGEQAMQVAHQKVQQAFGDALKGKVATPDSEFVNAARGPLTRLAGIKRDDLGQEIVGQIQEATKDLFDSQTGALTGENMQTFLESLRHIRQAYKNDPLSARVITPSIKGLESAVEGMFKRQAPDVMPKYNAAKAAYRRLSVLADAVNKGKNTDGIFTPGQLGLADRANGIKYGSNIKTASGDTPFFDYQRAAENVLPSSIPNSGTADRAAQIAIGAAVGGGGLASTGSPSGEITGGGIGLIGLLAALYTKTGQKAAAGLLLKRLNGMRAAGTALQKSAPYAGTGVAALTQSGGGQ